MKPFPASHYRPFSALPSVPAPSSGYRTAAEHLYETGPGRQPLEEDPVKPLTPEYAAYLCEGTTAI